jgi:ubiquinone/menaquinone biosynthesis C-methylase UbiE
MSNLLAIFQNEAPKYDLLVSREDYQDNLLPALNAVTQIEGKRIVEFGAGTGRLTRLLAPHARSIVAFDAYEPMLNVAERRLNALHLSNWRVAVADHRNVPVESQGADLAIAGWSICCLAVYEGEKWEIALEEGLNEMNRVVLPNGMVVIIETMGTGHSSPNPPEGLKPYYRVLELQGFKSTWIRTDYRFNNMDEALDLTTFFFGNEPVSALSRTKDGVILPECTGIWWKVVDRKNT